MDDETTMPAPAAFASTLFERVSRDDREAYGPREIERLAREEWEFLAERKPGEPKLRVWSPAYLPDVTVLDIANDDMPFLLDSVSAELAERGMEVRLLAHPILKVARDARGRRTAGAGDLRESFIHVHLERIDDGSRADELLAALRLVLADVRAAVRDWRPMLARVNDTIAAMRAEPPPLPAAEVAEAVQFLEWITDENFTFLGARDYTFTTENGEPMLKPEPESGLGILSDPQTRVLRRSGAPSAITTEIAAFLAEPTPLIVAKAGTRSRVHRRAYPEYIGIKRYDPAGNLTGELRIVGLFTSTAYTRSARAIPYLRRKVAGVLARAGFDPDSHSGKALINVLETYPRDDLFQIDEETLYRFAMAILQLDERPRVRVLARRDRFNRFVSALVYIPRDRFSSRVREAIGLRLAEAYEGHVSTFVPFFTEGPLVRVNFVIAAGGAAMASPDPATLDREVEDMVRNWSDRLALALREGRDAALARSLLARYRDAFPEGYRDDYTPAEAVADVRVIESLSAARPLGVVFGQVTDDDGMTIGLKVWSLDRPIQLSRRVPVLENMGFRVVDERTYHIRPRDRVDVWFHDMTLEPAEAFDSASFGDARSRLEATFLVVMSGGAENDGYNALALGAGLMWRDIALLRAISRYLRQIRIPYSQDYLWATLRRHPAIAADLVALFHTRFDPHAQGGADVRAAREADIAARIDGALKTVESLDEDVILRHFLSTVQAALRTNLFQLDAAGMPKPEIAVKFASRKIEAVPLPRPLYEIFVYSPRVEGVHLRFGKVARGGIRWSDRPQDFRTEILGLVKAQQVKNAVIVPVGAKGGFVPKQIAPGAKRDAIQAEGIATYRIFIDTLLDLTDDIAPSGEVIPPDDVVRHDGDDPYLVVAADKGTATFSDTANAIAEAHDFWLGDAFASGGSAGYDHKKMGITARGAWESVKRHFREMDVDIGVTPFTVAGVGDMSGDVFGNGMLRESTIKLVAAFDHRDIFLDPDPDPAASFRERQRLFELPRSSWQDYDKGLLSKGGGVFARSAKEIALSEEVQSLLGLAKAGATPHEVMRAILAMNVDLLFFGGIGTYVRASSESDEAVGDRANDAIRIAGAGVHAKVIGEGANLGMTQRGRVEAALQGVRLNTDAIDNSAGVNTSDVEVNIKIAVAQPMRDGALSRADRDALLAGMTEDVARSVLRNNYQQSLALSLTHARGLEDFGFQQRLMQALEVRGMLDRSVEYLPDDMALAERLRRNEPLTRPELAVLLAYAKLALNHDLIESDVPDDPYLARELGRYFPATLTARFPDAVARHRLRREIIATQIANAMINRGGSPLIQRIADQTGASAAAIALAFTATRDSFDLSALNAGIEALDNVIASDLQLQLFRSVQDLLLDRIVWFLRNVDLTKGLADVIAHYREGIAAVAAALDPQHTAPRRSELVSAGVPEDLAARLAALPLLSAAPDIVAVGDRAGKSVSEVAATYFEVASFFRLDRIARAARALVVSDYFDRLALDRALDTIGAAERRLTAAMVAAGGIEAWIVARRADAERTRDAVHQIAASGLTLSKLTVAASMLGDLARG